MPSVTRRSSGARLRREEVESHVFETVERLLEGGESFTTLGVQRICAEAEVARSSFYSTFADKTDLLLRLAESTTDDIFAVSQMYFSTDETAGPFEGLAFEGLQATQANSIRIFRAHAPLISALAEMSAYDEAVAAYWRGRMDRTIEATAQRIRKEQRAGRIRATLNPDRAARFIVAGAERSMFQQATTATAESDADAAAELTEMVLFLLYGDVKR